jgi:hypothetical protein
MDAIPTDLRNHDQRHDGRRGRRDQRSDIERTTPVGRRRPEGLGGLSDPDERARDLSGAGRRDVRPALVGHESRAPVLAALLVALALPFLMPAEYSPGAQWLLPLVEGALLVAALSVDPGGIDRRSIHVRRVRVAMIVIIVFGAAWATSWLAVDLVQGENVTDSAGDLLAAGSLVWIDLVIAFGFLYWELDSGGPGRRARGAAPPWPRRRPRTRRRSWRPRSRTRNRAGGARGGGPTPPPPPPRARGAARYPDLAFPQHLNPDVAPPGWRPVFVDYLYLGYTNAIAFSPTDVMPLAHWAKLAMGIESGASLVILGLVIARAVNILA